MGEEEEEERKELGVVSEEGGMYLLVLQWMVESFTGISMCRWLESGSLTFDYLMRVFGDKLLILGL